MKRAVDFALNTFAETNTRTAHIAATIFGIPASQTWADLMLWERFLNAQRPAHLIELGTGRGGLTLFLALQCRQRGIAFTTMDTVNWTDMAGPLFDLAQIKYVQGDVFADGPALVAHAHAQGGSVTVFCDDGDKPREFRQYAAALRPGDCIAVHDYGDEFHLEDTRGLPVAMIDHGVCEAAQSITRWYKVVAHG